MNSDTSHKANMGGVPNRGSLYAVAAAHSKEAIDTLYDLMKNSKNDGIRLGAAKAILNKALPDLKQSDLYDEDSSLPPEVAETIRKLKKGALQPDDVYHKMSPEYINMLKKMSKTMSYAQIAEFSPEMQEFLLESRNE